MRGWRDLPKAGLEKTKTAVLAVLGGLSDGTTTILSVTSGYRQSTGSRAEVLRDRKCQGLVSRELMRGEGRLGIRGAVPQVYPEAAEQRFWNRRILNVPDKLPK